MSFSSGFHKALVPLGEKAVLSHILDKFPKDIEIILAVGYNANLIRDFVKMAYSQRNIKLVEVDRYEGEGSGPGYSLNFCKDYLQSPFIFTSVDTVLLEDIPEPDKNWIGVAKVSDSKDYCVAETKEGQVKRFYDKMPVGELPDKNSLNSAFVGMAGVFDYQDFWKGFDDNKKTIGGELQVASGLEKLIGKNLYTVPFTWFDTGCDENYKKARAYFSKSDAIAKSDEFLYFEGENVIKYFADQKTVANRVARAKFLKGIVPDIIFASPNFYAYRFVKGKTLGKIYDVEVFKKFLEFCQEKLWKKIDLRGEEMEKFKEASKKCHCQKTKERISKFYEKTGIKDVPEKINGVDVPKLSSLLEKLDWDYLSDGIPVLFHGDTQPENIIVKENNSGFTLLDWRQDFGGLLEYGDLYYDFTKLHHALIVSQEVIKKGEYGTEINGNSINFHFLLKNNLCDFKDIFEDFLVSKGYDLKKVRTLSYLHFLNIAPLHHEPYDIFLYYLGKSLLYKLINK